ncbi:MULTISPECIES: hypothetical protein [unclassified Streptomyces]|uniref:hypothetical protein n=1 Tax=unclassified Streptomyces TaxID=2593676 RepID=UPI003788A3C1
MLASIGGLAGPLIGRLADATSLRTAPAPLILMPVLSWLLFRTLPDPDSPPPGPTSADRGRNPLGLRGGPMR